MLIYSDINKNNTKRNFFLVSFNQYVSIIDMTFYQVKKKNPERINYL